MPPTSAAKPRQTDSGTKQRRGVSFQRRLVIGLIAFVALPTVVTSCRQNEQTRQTMLNRHAEATATIADTICESLEGNLERDKILRHRALIQLTNNPKFAFVEIRDASDRVIYRHISDTASHAIFDRHQPTDPAEADANRPVYLYASAEEGLVVWRSPIFRDSAPAAMYKTVEEAGTDDSIAIPVETSTAIGNVTLAMRDTTLPAAIRSLQWSQFLSAIVVCLICLPIVLWFAHRTTYPLRQMIGATRRLASGQVPQPVRTGGVDEIDQLSTHFNQMARDLYAAQLRLQRANEKLQRQVDRRTSERNEARSKLAEQTRTTELLMQTLREELGVPINNIDAMATTLLAKYRNRLDDNLEDQLKRMDAHLRQQSTLVDEMLALATLRTTAGQFEKIDLNTVIRDLHNRFRAELNEHDIEFVHPHEPDALPTIQADPDRIITVFETLIENAIVHMGDAPTRQIRLTCADEVDCHELRFTVSDTGEGIDEDKRQSLFNLFERRRDAKRTPIHKHQLGLAGVKAIVESYGGRIWVESTPGDGCVFHLTFDWNQISEQPAMQFGSQDSEETAGDNNADLTSEEQAA